MSRAFGVGVGAQFDEKRYRDERYRGELGGYYSRGDAGYREHRY